MKFIKPYGYIPLIVVAPLAGAWIEICAALIASALDGVAPLAGAWIEIEE